MPLTDKQLDVILDVIVKASAESGLLVAVGWAAFQMSVRSQSAAHNRDMMLAFYAGAQHAFVSIVNMMDAEREPTEADLQKMDKLHKELDVFAKAFSEVMTTPPKSEQS